MLQALESPATCVLPWISVATTVDGVWGRCCFDATNDYDDYYRAKTEPKFALRDDAIGCLPRSRYAQDNPDRAFGIEAAFNSPAMRQTRLTMLQGELPSACRHCTYREALGTPSHRQAMNTEFGDLVDIAHLGERTAPDGTVDAFPFYLDLRFGNTCNLQCVMCCFPVSSRWDVGQHPAWFKVHIDPYAQDDELWQTLADHAADIRFIYFAGGEPFLQRGHARLLDLLVSSGDAATTELHYNSNLTVLPAGIFDQLRAFKRVRVAASCDGVGETFERIRVGAHWSTFVQHVRQAKQYVELYLDVTLQRDNVGDIANLLNFAASEQVSIRLENYVDYPQELSVRSLAAEERRQHSAAILALAGHYHEGPFADVGQQLERFVAYMNS
ncbi:MAG: twitch domain-containing radical SAM protein [Sciscionella sp.]